MYKSYEDLEAFEMVLMAFRTDGKDPCQRQAGMREMVTFVFVDVRVGVLLLAEVKLGYE